MININPGKNDSVNKLLADQLTNIQTQLDELSDRITSLDGATGTEIEEVKGNVSEISLILDNVIQTQQMTSVAFAELTESLNELKALLSDEVETKNINAIIAEIATINATAINTETVTAQTGNITDVNADNVNAENAKVTNLEAENLNIAELETESIKTSQAEVENLIGDSATITELTVEGIKSKQSYSSQSYGDNEKVDKFKFILNAGAIIYSEDADDPWSITWNGAIEYSNPNLTIKRIDTQKENDTVVAFVYFSHPNTDLSFSVINFGAYDITASYELMDKTTAYEEENTDYFGIIGESSSSAVTSLIPVYVEELPETGSAKYLYITPERQTYIWKDNSYFLPLTDKIEINQKTFTGLIWELQFKAAQIDVTDLTHKAFEGTLYSLKPICKCPILDEVVPNWNRDGLLWVTNGEVYYTDSNPLAYTSVWALPETVETNKELFSYLEWTKVCNATEFVFTVESIRVTSATENVEILGFKAVDYYNTKMNTNIDQLNYEVANNKWDIKKNADAILAEKNRAESAESALNILIENEQSRAEDAETELAQRVTDIEKLIPNTASEENKLADKNFVNSSISTNTANYIYKTETSGEKVPFESVAELEAYSGTVTNNDYAFVTGIDENGNRYYDRYKANVDGTVVIWAKEYRLNNSSFTAEQWAAIQSGITAEKLAELESTLDAVIETDVLPENPKNCVYNVISENEEVPFLSSDWLNLAQELQVKGLCDSMVAKKITHDADYDDIITTWEFSRVIIKGTKADGVKKIISKIEYHRNDDPDSENSTRIYYDESWHYSDNLGWEADFDEVKVYKQKTTAVYSKDHKIIDDNLIRTDKAWSGYMTQAYASPHFVDFGNFAQNVCLILPEQSIPIRTGYTVKVIPTLQVKSSKTSLRLMIGELPYPVKVARHGALIDFPCHKINDSSENYFMDAYTTLELVFNGECFVVMGNPTVISYHDDTVSYEVKADGFIEQNYYVVKESNLAAGGRWDGSFELKIPIVEITNLSITTSTSQTAVDIKVGETGEEARLQVWDNTLYYSIYNRNTGTAGRLPSLYIGVEGYC